MFRPQPGRVGFEWTAASASPKQRCGVGGGSPVPRLIRVTGLLVVRAELVRRGQLPPGSRARPSRGRTEVLEQWTESGTEYQRVDCGRSSCAAVKPSARAWRCLSLVRPRDCGARAGVFPSTVMTAIHVGVRSRSPRGWSDVGASDRGGFRAGDLVGLMSGYARRVTQPPPSGRTRVRSDRTPGA